ncbi:MAG: dTDP-4-dehydrorhamnose reductase [Acidobacteria bacterium]|nr:dTDP-4-dehydrorhamnose reductase [Acidobacteriota bacterium]
MRVLVTGASGLLGKSVTKYFQKDCKVAAFSRQELNIADLKAVEKAIKNFSPTVIINCAAMARVDACETDWASAKAANIDGPKNLAQQAKAVGASLMHISTDYVFDGTKTSPYTIDDAPNPISAYGRSKLLGEQAVIENTTDYFIVRVARLFGLGGSNFGSKIFDYLQTAKQNGNKVKVCDYPVSQATYLPDLVVRLDEIIKKGKYGTYQVTSSGDIVSWYEFACLAIKMMGLEKDLLTIVDYPDLGLPALRPRYSALRCLLSEEIGLVSLPNWEIGLKEIYEHWQKGVK